jgi:hypothetical protein
MTDTITVEIPADVKDNNTHTVRVVSNGVRSEEGGMSAAEQLSYYTANHKSLGYTMSELFTTDNGQRVTTTEFFSRPLGKVVYTFETRYYTRVDCARCVYHWAQAYVVVEQDGVTTDPEPLCGDHISLEETRINRVRRDVGTDTYLHRSEYLRIGKHE